MYRQGIADRKLERVVSLNGVQEAQDVAALFPWFGLAPDDSLLILRDTGDQEIYALDWEAHVKVLNSDERRVTRAGVKTDESVGRKRAVATDG